MNLDLELTRKMFTSNNMLSQLLDTFYQCKNNGLPCRLHLETNNGEQFFNISMKIPAGFPNRKTNFKGNAGNKSPSTIRRDRARFEKWKLTKSPPNSIPTKLDERSEETFQEKVEASASPVLKKTIKSNNDGSEIKNPSQSDILDNSNINSSLNISSCTNKGPSVNTSKEDEFFMSEEDKNDIAQMCRAAFNKIGENSYLKNVETDEGDFDEVKRWALAQKKGKN